MIILDAEQQLKNIESTLKHHGTNTQGEEFRQKQVAEHILEMFDVVMNMYNATREIDTNLIIHFSVR